MNPKSCEHVTYNLFQYIIYLIVLETENAFINIGRMTHVAIEIFECSSVFQFNTCGVVYTTLKHNGYTAMYTKRVTILVFRM